MNKKDEYAKGQELGIAAFRAGKKAAPCHDKALMDYIASLGSRPIGSALPALNGWVKGWHTTNLAEA